MRFLDKILIKLKLKKAPVTLEDVLANINSKYHFTKFDENLISEIYSELIGFGMVAVSKISRYSYILDINQVTKIDKEIISTVYTCKVTEEGFTYEKL